MERIKLLPSDQLPQRGKKGTPEHCISWTNKQDMWHILHDFCPVTSWAGLIVSMRAKVLVVNAVMCKHGGAGTELKPNLSRAVPIGVSA